MSIRYTYVTLFSLRLLCKNIWYGITQVKQTTMADPNAYGRSGFALQAARRRSYLVGNMAVSESLKDKQVSKLRCLILIIFHIIMLLALFQLQAIFSYLI